MFTAAPEIGGEAIIENGRRGRTMRLFAGWPFALTFHERACEMSN